MVWARRKAPVVAVVLFGILLATASSCSTASDEQPPTQYEGRRFAALGQAPDVVVPPPNRVIIAVPGLGSAPETVEFASPFELQEVSQDDTSLFFSFVHRVSLRADEQRPEVPAILVLADGRPHTISGARGSVLLGGNVAGWISVPLAALPESELDLTVRFVRAGAQRTLFLRKEETKVSALQLRERKGYRELVTVDPDTGHTLRGATIEGPVHDVINDGVAP
jgi:hypothetical protein